MKYIVLRKFNTKLGWRVCFEDDGTFFNTLEEAVHQMQTSRLSFPNETYKVARVLNA